jgi:hypothetical protein
MAELINLQEADKYLKQCGERLTKFNTDLINSRDRVWSSEQLDQLIDLLKVVTDLKNTVSLVMHNNRDGRGTPPAKGKLNSMLDRTR